VKKPIFMALCLLFVAGTAVGDWIPGDGHKMHYPQLPDPCGWDIDFGAPVPQLADDWMCSESGYVEDFHFWISWKGDNLDGVTGVVAKIYADDRTGPYSKPGVELWDSDLIKAENFTFRHYGDGLQGWYDPLAGEVIEDDHVGYYQINVDYLPNPFYQEQGTIYWLGICVTSETEVGWKTSESPHFEDDAVVWDGQEWLELRDPLTQESLDLAFVITPEPTSMVLLGLGGLALLLRRRKTG
jgi:hypothetical protein